MKIWQNRGKERTRAKRMKIWQKYIILIKAYLDLKRQNRRQKSK